MAVSVGGDEGDALNEINVTPLVDVLLCLLIIFMVSAPPATNTQMPLDIPAQSKVPGADPNATLLLSIDPAGVVKLGTQVIAGDDASVIAALKANQKVQSDGKLAIDAAPGTKYGEVIRLMAAAHEAGVGSVGIASDRL
ncbi:ExbD/TolR family protein [Nannocystis radixulma]|uniref:Biopolymer transporter ExbD n=1 Tax=Nannocystis radixulma TaxID=2995305 RepID=A0ABT5B813_9BACT|nr:biopolymer transporter ExbD [Nannocystis radixulma]MDC0669608.1 biopolymer transporter ExbD [Nannocystis radixulma]